MLSWWTFASEVQAMKFINSIEVLQSLHVVFSFTSDFCNLPKWNYAVIKTEQLSEGPVDKGTVFRQQRQFLGRRPEDTFIITEYKADSIVTIKSIKAEYPFLISYSFTPSGRGTLLTNHFELHGGLLNLPGYLLTNRVKKAVAENLNRLKDLAEKI